MGLFEGFRREEIYISSVGRSLFRMRHVKPDSPITVVDIVEDFAAKTSPTAPPFFIRTARSPIAISTKPPTAIARWARAVGVAQGEVVALLMENRPEYLMAWLGLHQSRVQSAALINTNLRGMPLAHSIAISARATPSSAPSWARLIGEAAALIEAGRSPGLTGGALLGCARSGCRAWHRSRPRPIRNSAAPASPARTTRSTSSPPAPRACPRPRISAICACCS